MSVGNESVRFSKPGEVANENVDIVDPEKQLQQFLRAILPKDKRSARRILNNKPLLSSVSLQQLLYYHTWYSLTWAIFFLFMLRYKRNNFTGFRVTYFSPAFFTIWAVCEVSRFYAGWMGNLQENTPNMAAFLFLTCFPQMLLTIYFLYIQYPLFVFDQIFNTIHLILLIFEFWLGWRTLKVFIADKTARFAVEFGEVDQANDNRAERTNVTIMQDYIESGLGIGEGEDPLERKSAEDASRYILPPSRSSSRSNLLDDNDPTSNGGIEMTTMSRSTPYSMYHAPLRGSAPGNTLPPLSQSHRNMNFSSTSPFTPLPASSAPLNETLEEKLSRRERDRAIIRGELRVGRRERRRRGDDDGIYSSLDSARSVDGADDLYEHEKQALRLSTSRPTTLEQFTRSQPRIPIPSSRSNTDEQGTEEERQRLKNE